MTFRTRFLLLASGWTVLSSCLVVGLPLTFADRLPDPIASHWGTRGVPDDSMPQWALTAVALGLFAAVALPSLGVAIHGAALRRRHSRAWLAAALAWAGVFTVALMTLTVWANLDATDWRAARPLGWQVVLVTGASFVAGGLGFLVGRRGPDDPPDRAGRTRPSLTPQPGERVTWVSSATNTTLLATAIVLLAASVVLAVLLVAGLPSFLWSVAGTLAATGIAGLLVTSIRVQVTDAGVATAFGPLRWPVHRVPLGRVHEAWAEHRRPSKVGGWGYRGLPGGATIMIRGGECLVIRYRSGGTLGISVDDADRGAALLNGLLERTT